MTYGGLMWLAFHAFVLTYEEPVLAQRFGGQYEDFRANVPRWDSAAVPLAHRMRAPTQRRRGEPGPDRSTLNLVVRRKP